MEDISLIKSIILETFGENFKSKFQKSFIMDYDNFINQIIFELYYDDYTENCGSINLADFHKKENLNDNNIKTIECIEDPEYKQLKRSYKKYRTHNDNNAKTIYEKSSETSLNGYEKEHNIQYQELTTPQERAKGHKLRVYQIFQQKNLMKYKIFKQIENGRIASSKKLKDPELIDMLVEFENIYEEINKKFNTNFEKCIQYYQLENMCGIEIKHLIAKALKMSNKKLKEKEIDKRIFKSLMAVSYMGEDYQNRFVIGNQEYVNKYIEGNYKDFEEMPMEILELCRLKLIAKKIIKDKLSKKGFVYNYIKEEDFFEKFLGSGQHIHNKEWEKIKLKDFRDFYIGN
ncbi:MAG: hypothetical protein N4A57_07990 [Anaeromicrobium sp.]|jgi:hypothetical protein|uniref:hypothetical protein n=1 Tax=Anaeromicrobium sp. TaxID=1929132 RepID=UPI0025E2CCCD|nr:hypothetical protein [Anaeromicrobium sp.]MCT4594191.1 hypothetical protein [Anaeromicrobium sp.]